MNIELALLQNRQCVYGTYAEVEAYAEEIDSCVERYLDHVNPSTVQKNFDYIGKGSDPYAVAKQFYVLDEEGFAVSIKKYKEKF